MVEEARASGKTCMAHAQGTQGIKNAVLAGVESIEHGIYLDDEAIGMMLDRGTYLVPTLVAPRGVLEARDRGIPVPQVMIDKTLMVMDTHAASIKAAIAAGATGLAAQARPRCHRTLPGDLPLLSRPVAPVRAAGCLA